MSPVASSQFPAVHLVVPTHTTRHLACCISSIALQRVMPATVVVSCDGDGPEIGALLDEVWPRVVEAIGSRRAPRLVHVQRRHQGRAMLNQVRNNGLQALESAGALDARDVVLVVDGDTLLAPDAVSRHAELAAMGFELVIPYRVNLPESMTGQVTVESVLRAAVTGSWGWGTEPDPDTREALGLRHRRYQRQLLMRRVLPVWTGVNKPHKPKVLGGHHAVSAGRLRAVNGYDEEYTSYGFDDDDLSRRLHALRPPPKTAIAVKDILAFHLWHPTRAPARPTEAPGYERFAQELPTVAVRGWGSPLDQAELGVRVVRSAGAATASAG